MINLHILLLNGREQVEVWQTLKPNQQLKSVEHYFPRAIEAMHEIEKIRR